MKKIIAICMAGALLTATMAGCSSNDETEAITIDVTEAASEDAGERAGQQTTSASATATESAVELLSLTSDDQFSAKDYEIGCIADDFVIITLADGANTCEDSSVIIDGDIITITQEGAYLLSGSLSNGQIVVDADDEAKIQLCLDGVQLFNSATAPIYVAEADKVFITTASGSDNAVTATLVEDDTSNIDSAIFSKADLTLNGAGSLTVSATDGNGITSKDDLAITSGTYTITAGGHGLEANNSIRIAGGTFQITSQKDGLHAEHDEDPTLGYIYIVNCIMIIDAQGDGMDGSGQVLIEDGVYDILTAGGHENATEQTSTMGGQMGSRTEQMSGQMSGQTGQISGQMGGQMMPTSNNTTNNSGATYTTLAGGGQQGMQSGMTGQMDGQMTQGTMPDMGEMPTMPDMGEMPTMAEGQTMERPTMDGTMGVTIEEDDSVSTKGIKAGTGLVIQTGTFTLDVCDDGFHADQTLEIFGGTFTIAAGDDAIRADMTTTIHDGTITITACYEGIEGETVVINGGDIDITASDDGINATRSTFSDSSDNISITINGGNLTIDSYNEGDGLDSNGDILVTGGNVLISSTTVTTDTALDYGGGAIITGGTFLVSGSNSRTTQNFEEGSTQGSIYVELPSVVSSTISLTDSSGNLIAQYTPVKEFQAILLSTPEIVVGETYTLTVGDYTETIVMDSLIYGEGNESTMSGGQMQGGQMQGGQMQGGMGGR